MMRHWFIPLLLATHVAGQAAPAKPGVVAERITSVYDRAQSYAVYLPSTHSAQRRWPVLLLMDPRGRALVPLERFRVPAEQYGYILISSYNTLSDGDPQANVDAASAILADARQLFSGDTTRVYLAGFSGTARVAWGFAAQLPNVIAGIFDAGASGVLYTRPGRPLPQIPFYGAWPSRFQLR